MLAQAEGARRAVSAVFLLCGTLGASWAVNIPAVRDHLGLSAQQLGFALLSTGIGNLCSMPFTGRLSVRYGSQRLTAALAVLTMLSLIPPFFMPNLASLMAALWLMGTLTGALDVAMNAQGSRLSGRSGAAS